jgi:hypothetical protein
MSGTWATRDTDSIRNMEHDIGNSRIVRRKTKTRPTAQLIVYQVCRRAGGKWRVICWIRAVFRILHANLFGNIREISLHCNLPSSPLNFGIRDNRKRSHDGNDNNNNKKFDYRKRWARKGLRGMHTYLYTISIIQKYVTRVTLHADYRYTVY